jgi:hypothetical protein
MTGCTDAAGREICGALNRQGKPCGQTRLYPNGRCYRHGGPSRGGLAHPNYQGKGYSKLLPINLRGSFERSLTDPDALSMRRELALLDTRQEMLLGQLSEGGALGAMARLRKLEADFTAAEASTESQPVRAAKMGTALHAIRLLARSFADDTTWAELDRVIARRQAVVESERRRAIEARQVVRADEAMVFATDLAMVVKTAVESTAPADMAKLILQRISAGWQPLVARHQRETPAPALGTTAAAD